MGKPEEDFADPVLEPIEGSEIAAAVDVSTFGDDNIFRPVYLNQDEQIIALTVDDARRLLRFMTKAVKFLEEFESRKIQ